MEFPQPPPRAAPVHHDPRGRIVRARAGGYATKVARADARFRRRKIAPDGLAVVPGAYAADFALRPGAAGGLLDPDPAVLRATSLGRRFLNELVALFLRDRPRTKGPA